MWFDPFEWMMNLVIDTEEASVTSALGSRRFSMNSSGRMISVHSPSGLQT